MMSFNSLQLKSMKAIFNSLDPDAQQNLVQELMEIAGIDSVIEVNRIVKVAGLDITAPKDETIEANKLRQYRDHFERYLIPWLSTFLKIVRRDYLDQCFDIYQILARKSVGSCYESQEDVGDQFLWAKSEPMASAHGNEYFHSIDERQNKFEHQILISGDIKIELVTLLTAFPNKSRLIIKLIDLYVILLNWPLKAYMVLMLFGYLEGDERRAEIEAAFREEFPEITNLQELAALFPDREGECYYSHRLPGLKYCPD